MTEPRFRIRRTHGVRNLSVIVAAAAVLAAAAACGGSSSNAASPAPSSAAAVSSAPASSAPAGSATTTTSASAESSASVVTIKNFAFAVPATVPAGASVQVKNDDGEAHTVTADSGGAFDTTVGGKGTASFTAPAKPGRYPFHCKYHGNMHGVLVVT